MTVDANAAAHLALLHDPRIQEWKAGMHATRLTEEVQQLVVIHRASIDVALGPAKWDVVHRTIDGDQLRHRGRRLLVIWSIALEDDGRPWLHVSASMPTRSPFHDEMAEVRRLFVGEDRYAYAVWPPADRYVNLSPFVLHLWAPWWPDAVDAPPLPEFSAVPPGGPRTI